MNDLYSLILELTLSQFQSVKKGLTLLSILINPSNPYLSVYNIITELNNMSPTPFHWTLTPFLSQYIARKQNLASLLTLVGSYELCRIIGPSREEEFFARLKIPQKHQIVIRYSIYIDI
jgi:hypothetical protein